MPRTRPTLLLLVALCVVATAAATAATARAPHRLKDGNFRGRTTRDRTATLTVAGGGRRVRFTLPWARIAGRHCHPRRAYVNANFAFDHGRGALLRADRRFAERIHASQRGARGTVLHYDVRVAGGFDRAGRRAAGTVGVSVRFTHRGRRRTIASCATRFAFSARRR